MAFGESLVSWAHSLCLDLWGSSWEYHGDKTPIFQRSLYSIGTYIYNTYRYNYIYYIYYTLCMVILCVTYIYIYGVSIIDLSLSHWAPLLGISLEPTHLARKPWTTFVPRSQGKLPNFRIYWNHHSCQSIESICSYLQCWSYQYYSSSVVVTIFCCS